MLLELRKRYLDVPSGFRDLIDQAISEIERFSIERVPEAPEAAPSWASRARTHYPNEELI